MDRTMTTQTLAGLLLMLRNAWGPDGKRVELSLRSQIVHEIASALEVALPILLEAPERVWVAEQTGEKEEKEHA